MLYPMLSAGSLGRHWQGAARLGTALGSPAVTALCRNGLGVALSLQGDHQSAAVEHQAAYGWYEQTGSPSGLAYTGARLAMLRGPDDAKAMPGAVESLHLAVQTRDPRAVATAWKRSAWSPTSPPTPPARWEPPQRAADPAHPLAGGNPHAHSHRHPVVADP
jgi:hypothetical protein